MKEKIHSQYKKTLFLLFVITAGCVLFSCFDRIDNMTVLLHLRLPRVLSAFIAGGLLALAGALMQILVRNPLADPYLLGVSSGAGVGMLLGLLLGLSGLGLTLCAWSGSALTLILIFLLTFRMHAAHSPLFLLVGIAIASGFSALMSCILLLSSNTLLRNMLFWLMGDITVSRLPFFEGGVLVICAFITCYFATELNVYVRGEHVAQSLGVDTDRLRWMLYITSSFCTATAVLLAGCIGFVGLIVPHLFRLFSGYDHRYLIPGSILLGGTLVTLADWGARTLFYPQEIPVGMMLVFFGVPTFIYLLQRQSR